MYVGNARNIIDVQIIIEKSKAKSNLSKHISKTSKIDISMTNTFQIL